MKNEKSSKFILRAKSLSELFCAVHSFDCLTAGMTEVAVLFHASEADDSSLAARCAEGIILKCADAEMALSFAVAADTQNEPCTATTVDNIQKLCRHYDVPYTSVSEYELASPVWADNLPCARPEKRNPVYANNLAHSTAVPAKEFIREPWRVIKTKCRDANYETLCTSAPGEALDIPFYGTAFGVVCVSSPDAAVLSCQIDGGEQTSISVYSPSCFAVCYILAAAVRKKKHTARLWMKKDESSPPDSTLRLISFCVQTPPERALSVRERLLLCGIDELRKSGVKNFSMRRAAAACGVSCSAPYKHFSGKDDYISQIIAYINSQWDAIQKKTAAAYAPDTRRQLIEVSLAYISFLVEHPSYRSIIMLKDKNSRGSKSLAKTYLSIGTKSLVDHYCAEVGMSAEVALRKEFVVRSLIFGAALMIDSGELTLDCATLDMFRSVIAREFDIE